jgi:mannosyltransferase OCH1-like enzyme
MTIQTLWIGEALSPMERLCLTSFLQHGHDVHLYVYEEVRNIPAGVTVRDAAEILPASRIFRYREHNSVAGFANFFRYKLLHERGGWWVDTDIICLRPFTFEDEYVFGAEISYKQRIVNNCVIRASAGSAIMERAWHTCDARDPTTLKWGETGPKLLTQLVEELGLDRYVQGPEVFCPIPWSEWRKLAYPDTKLKFPRTTRAVHLWNEMWRRNGVDKNALDAEQLYARLQAGLR